MSNKTPSSPGCTKSQNNRILAYLREGHSLTGLEALRMFGVIHLPRRILDLKERGCSIADEWVWVGKDHEKRVKCYSLVSEAERAA